MDRQIAIALYIAVTILVMMIKILEHKSFEHVSLYLNMSILILVGLVSL
jgi:hypothetical protein